MVEEMKRIDLLMSAAEADVILDDLQNLSVMHLVQKPVEDDAGILEIEKHIAEYRQISQSLHHYRKSPEDFSSMIAADKISDAQSLQKEYLSVEEEQLHLTAEKDVIKRDLALLEPWGDFEWHYIREIQEAGVRISFHILAAKVFKKTDFSNRHIECIHETSSQIHFIELIANSSESPLFPEEDLPHKYAHELKIRQGKIKQQLLGIRERFMALSLFVGLLDERIEELEQSHERRMAELALNEAADGHIMHLSGYLPVSLLPQAEDFLADRNIVPVFSKPNEDEDIPVRLKNSAFFRLFEPITRIFSLPLYSEIDPTLFFAPFFALFVGLCLADVGYGSIISLAALTAVIFSKKSSRRSLAILGFLFGLTTILGGIFLNTAFGAQITEFSNLPDGIGSLIFFQDQEDAMNLSIFLGVVQLLLGFILQVVNNIRKEGFLGGLQPAGTFLLLAGVIMSAISLGASVDFSIGPLLVGRWLNPGGYGGLIGLSMLIAGVLLILLFNNIRLSILFRPLTGLWELYQTLTALLSSVLSYIRLFALGLAGGLLGGAINLIAFMVRGDNPSLLSWFFMTLVLIGGHAINFALAALAAFVHPLRLTFVEFYGSVDFSGGGTPYTPYGGKTL